jgi:uncharacterized protein
VTAPSISPVFDTPLLQVEGETRVLVAADLHLGLEYELWLCGVSIPSQTEKILECLKGHLKEISPDRLLLLGDVKHNVPRTSWQERREIPYFLKALSKEVKVEIIPGNHDAGLADLATMGTRVRSATGLVLDDIGYFHGHAWPEKSILEAKTIVAGHLHPGVRLKEPVGHPLTKRVWVRTPLKEKPLQEQYGVEISAPEMIVVPAFNDLCRGLPLNEPIEDERGPLPKIIDLEASRLYLLDGTDLGKLSRIKSTQSKM